VILVELGDSGFQGELAPSDLELLDQIGGAGKEHAPAVLDEPEADGGGEMRFPTARGTKHEQVVALLEPAVAGDERHDLRLREHRHGVEVVAVEGLARQQARLGEVALDATAGAFGDLVFCECREKAGGWPTLSVGTLGKAGPDVLDTRQAQVAEQKTEAGLVDRVCRGHAEVPSTDASARAS
jgi:hypothetical protein